MRNILLVSLCILTQLVAVNTFAQKRIVVLGSSTAAGNGASVDSSWVARLWASFRKNTSDGVDTLIDNRAYPGYVTYKGLSSDYPMPADRTTWSPDPLRNVTWVLAQSPKPDIVLLSYVSNDVNLYPNYTEKETMNNLRLMYQSFTSAGIRCFVTSSQPRNDMSDAQRTMLRELRDSIINAFKLNSILFWDDLVTNDGLNRLRDEVNSGDGIHPNNYGHRLLFEKVQAKNIFVDPSPAPLPAPAPLPNSTSVPGKVEAENYTNMYGIQTENTSDVGGGKDVGWQDDNDWMDYSVSVTAAGTYTVNFRVASMFTGAQFQLRNSSGTVLTTVTVPNTGSFQTWQTLSASVSLSAGSQTLRIYTLKANGGWNINWWELQTSATSNQAPLVNAGSNQTITLPTSSTTLSGNATDADGTISSYLWSQISGPSNATISNPTSPQTTINGLIQGVYSFKLTATDNAGASSGATVSITVNASAPSATTIHIESENYTAMFGIQTEATSDAGGGQDVGWQDDGDWMDYSINVSSAGTYTIAFRVASMFTGAQFQLRNSSGTVLTTVTVPNTGSFQTWQTVTATATLTAGQQTLKIYTLKANGGWNLNWWEIAGGTTVNQAPTVNAGSNQTITLPTSSTMLSGSASDPDGTISSYLWSQVSGPSTATISNANSPQTNVSSLVQGSYIFKLTATDNSGASSNATVTITVNAATTATLHIEAENYAAMFGVQTEATSDAGGGQNIGWQDDNDWMDYSVSVAAAGTYTVNFRVATIFSGAQFQLRNSAGTVLTTVTVPNTGSFQTWQTVSASVTLPAGAQTLRIYTLKANGGWNINWWEIQGASSAPSSIHIEAENFSSQSGIQTENTSDAGGGKNVGWQDTGDWMDYSMNITTGGTYTLNFRVATIFTGAQFQLRNSSGTILTTVTVPNTGGFQTWQTVSATATLPAGQQTLRVYTNNAAGGWNINWWEIMASGSAPVTIKTISSPEILSTETSLKVFTNPVTDRLLLNLNNSLTGKVSVDVINMAGQTVKQFNLTKSLQGTSQWYLFVGNIQKGTYLVKLSMGSQVQSVKVIKE